MDLAAQKVNVNPLLVAGRPLHWNDEVLRVDVRPMIAGRHFDGSPHDLQDLGTSLAACHRALVDSRRAPAVRAAASARYERLGKVRDLLADALRREAFELFAEQASWAGRHRDWLGAMVDHFEPRLDERPAAQCLHGEVHPGNVVFRSEDGAAVLVDFEESVHVFAPPAWDVAFLVQRFCLSDEPTLALAEQRLAIVWHAYGGRVPGLAEMMRQAAWFSIAAILDMRVSQGIVTPVAEYEKFVRLERQGRCFEEVL
jgi:Ser/Thr protein kinase RdoA (MazF antagonist)